MWETIGLGIGIDALKAAARPAIRRARKVLQGPRRSKHWRSRLNKEFARSVLVYREATEEPHIVVDGDYQLTDSQRTKAKEHKRELEERNRPNDSHAIVQGEPSWRCDPVVFHVGGLDFASVQALRDDGVKPEILSVSAVILCSETRRMIVHKRSMESATFKGCLHTFGGAYMPPGYHVKDDGTSLVTTVLREVLEESRISLHIDSSCPMILAKELATGFVQLVFLGIDISGGDARRIEHTWEGNVEQIAFSELIGSLRTDNWVPSGKVHVLAWLALGAPGLMGRARFGEYSPRKAFDSLVPR